MERRSARLTLALAAAALLADAPLQSSETAKDRLLVDASAVGAPISPWIYGQFIEHLGRCIYGGLWAEMLEDRKFFYPVTGEAPAWEMFQPGPRSWDGEGHPYELLVRSPWLILGEKSAVGMTKEAAYHAMRGIDNAPRRESSPATTIAGAQLPGWGGDVRRARPGWRIGLPTRRPTSRNRCGPPSRAARAASTMTPSP